MASGISSSRSQSLLVRPVEEGSRGGPGMLVTCPLHRH